MDKYDSNSVVLIVIAKVIEEVIKGESEGLKRDLFNGNDFGGYLARKLALTEVET